VEADFYSDSAVRKTLTAGDGERSGSREAAIPGSEFCSMLRVMLFWLSNQVAKELGRWRKRAACLGVGLVISVLLWTPFFEGGPLHRFWTSFGRIFAVLSMVFLLPCLYSAGTMVSLWWYGTSLRRNDRQFATETRNPKKRHP
jgi:hypothetical protein